MKKNIILLTLFCFALTMRAQEKQISIGPENFINSVGVKISLEKKENLIIKLFDLNKEEVIQFQFQDTKSNFFNLNLDSLSYDSNYTIQVYLDEKLIHAKKIYKNPKQ